MKTKTFEIKFVRTYRISQWMRDIIIENNPEEYLLDYFDINDYLSTRMLKPKKESILHYFIEEKLQNEFKYEARKCPDFEEWNEMTQRHLNKSIDSNKFEDNSEYREKIEKLISEKILPKITNEVFYILFNDREFLYRFNLLISEKIQKLLKKDYPTLLKKDGVIYRLTYWPEWLKKAVLYRDKGTCCNCYRDVSGLLNINGKIHLDHVIPLNKGGTNDTSNIQLLCETCNLKKSDHIIKGNYLFFKHY